VFDVELVCDFENLCGCCGAVNCVSNESQTKHIDLAAQTT